MNLRVGLEVEERGVRGRGELVYRKRRVGLEEKESGVRGRRKDVLKKVV